MHFTDFFRCTSGDAPVWTRYVSLYSNNAAMRDALRRQIATAAVALPGSSSAVVQRVLAHLPLAPQVGVHFAFDGCMSPPSVCMRACWLFAGYVRFVRHMPNVLRSSSNMDPTCLV